MFNFKNLLLILLIFFFNFPTNATIKIKYKIGDEIITNIDIINEKKYLKTHLLEKLLKKKR